MVSHGRSFNKSFVCLLFVAAGVPNAAPVAGQTLLPEPDPVPKCRYISFQPPFQGAPFALRVTLTNGRAPFNALSGLYKWVDAPTEIDDASNPSGLVYVGRLTDRPVFVDWSTIDVLHVGDRYIFPDAVYEVQAIAPGCSLRDMNCYSPTLEVRTAPWGDVTSPRDEAGRRAPDGAINFTDIGGIVEAFKSIPSAPPLVCCDLDGEVPSASINFSDIGYAVEAFKEVEYPFAEGLMECYREPSEPSAPCDNCPEPGLFQLRIGPIDGLTTAWHDAPSLLAVPLGTTLRFLHRGLPPDATVRWCGATPPSGTPADAAAQRTFDRVGPQLIHLTVTNDQGSLVDRTVVVDVIDVPIGQIKVGPIHISVAPFELDENATNEQTVETYFADESIASLRNVGDGAYRTSVDRTLHLRVDVDPPALAPLIEWRMNGQVVALGPSIARVFDTPGTRTIAAGPPADPGQIEIETYRVTITSHKSLVDIVPEGEPITFEAVTDPSGYEDEITWLSSTTYGTATPVLGSGATFTVQFDDTFGDHPTNGWWQWLGVKADNATFGQDQKALPLPIGVDLFESSGIVNLAIQADFFAVGSAPFNAPVALQGVPLGTRGAFELGTTDTVIERLDPVDLPPEPSDVQIPVEFVELSLGSVNPITVIVNGTPEDWSVFVEFGPGAPSSEGVLDLSRTGSDEGSFNMQIPLVLTIRFEKVGDIDIKSFDPGEVVLTGTGGTWEPTATCSSRGLAVPHLSIGLCLGIDLSSELLDLTLAAPSVDAGRPPAIVDPDATIDPNVGSLGRNAVISAGAFVGEGAIVGPNAFIGPNAVIGDRALAGDSAVIAAGANLEPGAIVDGGAQVGMNASIGADAVIGRSCVIGQGTQIGEGTRIGGQSTVGAGAVIGAGVDGERELFIGDEAFVAQGLFLARTAQVSAFTEVTEDLLVCTVGANPSFVATASVCEAAEGWVFGLVPGLQNLSNRVTPGTEVEPIDPQNLPAALQNLQNDVNNAGSGDAQGAIINRGWVATTHDCDDFAHEMEVALTALGYDATFTCYWCWADNPDHHWYNWAWTSGTINTSAHCLTDVRQGGKTIWIEPQNGAIGVDLDFDNDGKVEFATTHNAGKVTDDNYRIEVYDDRAAALGAGIILD